MTRSEIEANISHLHAHLAEAPDLSEADKVALRNGIGDLQDKLALLDFQSEGEDFDFGHHSEWEWKKSLTPTLKSLEYSYVRSIK